MGNICLSIMKGYAIRFSKILYGDTVPSFFTKIFDRIKNPLQDIERERGHLERGTSIYFNIHVL